MPLSQRWECRLLPPCLSLARQKTPPRSFPPAPNVFPLGFYRQKIGLRKRFFDCLFFYGMFGGNFRHSLERIRFMPIFLRVHKFDHFEISRFFFLLTNPAGASPGGMVTDEVGMSGTGSKVPQPAKRLIVWGVRGTRMPPPSI